MSAPAETLIESVLPSAEPLKLSSHDAYLVDDLIQRACELASIPPVFKYLTALYDVTRKFFLDPSQTIGGDGQQHRLQLRLRFHPYSLNSIMGSVTTLDYYYHQMRYFLLNGYKLKDQNVDLVNRLIGLVVTDYVRELLETDQKPDEEKTVNDLISSSFPTNWKFSWWKKLIVRKDFIQKVQTCYDNSNQDVAFVKCGYIEEMWQLLRESRQEHFNCQILVKGAFYACRVNVGHTEKDEKAKDGPYIQVVCAGGEIYASFPISHLCYLNVVRFELSSIVEVHVRSELPFSLKLDGDEKPVEFLTLLDGYFRMTERFMTCLCGQVQNPSILELKKKKCHGPMRPNLAHEKLKNQKNRQGSFLIRQNPLHYRMFVVDVLSADREIRSHTVVETADGDFRLERDPPDNAFHSITTLVSSRLNIGQKLNHLLPSDYDLTGLQFCKAPTEEVKPQQEDQNGQVLKALHLKIERGDFRITAHQRVSKARYKDREVVLRSIHDETQVISFQNKADEILSWSCREIVPVLGIIITHPVSLVFEYMPMGSLDMFLKKKGDELSIGDLGDASLCIAKAAWYLEEKGFVHGRIRCRSAFVVECAPSSFKVKLGDPGLLNYNEDDVHWIAPEYLSVMDSVAYSQKADLYALGTTMWEIFNKARNPSDIVPLEEARSFYASGKRLSLMEVPQEFCAIVADCWEKDPDLRRPPHSIVRDIHQLLYQIYQPKKYNTYAAIEVNTKRPKDDSSEAPTLPPLRTVTGQNKPLGSGLQRRESSVSQSSIASRRGWLNNPVMNLFRPYKQKEYDALSDVSSVSPSELTMTTYVPGKSGQPHPYLVSLSEDNQPAVGVDPPPITEQDWLIDRKDLKLGNPLGQGFFGMVFKATLVRYAGIMEEEVAVKRMKATVAEFSHKDLEREIEIMKKLRHPHIVEIRGIVEEPEIMLVMEFLELGSLLTYLQCNAEKLTHTQLIKYSYDVASAMAYLEAKKIIHRDLAARNILVQSETCVKISDFGLAHVVNKDYYMIQTIHRHLPIKWYAPESILFGKFSLKSDVWSYGVAIWEMFSHGEDPMLNDIEDQTSLGEYLRAGKRLPCPEGCPPDVYQVMRDCWRTDCALRPTFASLLETTKRLVETTG